MFLAIMATAAQLAVLPFSKHFNHYVPPHSFGQWLPSVGIAAIGVLGVLSIVLNKSGHWFLGLAALLHLFLACWTIHFSAKPFIDVWLFHQDSAAALLRGENPYAITFKNVYGEGSVVYSAEVQKDGRVLFGFPYPPMSMWMYLPSYWLTGESRYAHAAAYALSALGIGLMSQRRLARAAAVMLLTAPACWLVISSAWTEPFLLISLVGLALVALRVPAWTPVMLGLFLAMKQYNVIFLPLVFLILPRPLKLRTTGRFFGIAVATGLAVSLPLALWDWAAFWNSNVTIQVKQPFRYDAFSFLALVANAKPAGFVPPNWWSGIAFALLVPTWAVLLWRLPRNIGGFVLGVSLTSIVFLFSNRQAFLNYHTFAAGAMLLAIATLDAVTHRDEDPARSP
ncbi:MAG: hypothetical protein H7144_11310 [Burkholderiales bacterium]|nr:hypothetical protein [Phycisphaerae bacterium]